MASAPSGRGGTLGLARAVPFVGRGADVEAIHLERCNNVTIRANGREVEYTVVGGYESDPTQHTISHQSPLGRALMGKKAGDKAIVNAPAGQMTYEILAVT